MIINHFVVDNRHGCTPLQKTYRTVIDTIYFLSYRVLYIRLVQP